MYVTTFYSFKGGVGRTMALVNVAVELANRGRRVLAVDFDLEAPGLDTFDLGRPSETTPGIVDFVGEYMATNQAPAATDFLFESSHQSDNGGRLWVMPSGSQDERYATKLGAIDWGLLYQQHDGYLLFEDLKEQWRADLDPDYVLIDSRTGYTDVGGICTRQMPDAVVVLFFPNQQNLRGLTKIVRDIRAERRDPHQKEIDLHFVLSNVPDLDDEDAILEEIIASFQADLSLERAPLFIHRYNSLALLNQTIFTKDRPRSRLAKQYVDLTSEVARYNPEDPDGALEYLGRLRQASRDAERGRSRSQSPNFRHAAVKRRLELMEAADPQDGELLFRLWQAKRDNDFEQSGDLLNRAIERGFREPHVFEERARYRRWEANDPEGASADALEVFQSKKAGFASLMLVLRMLSPKDLEEVPDSQALAALPPRQQVSLVATLTRGRSEALVAARVLKPLIGSGRLSVEDLPRARNALTLALMAQGRCCEALELMEMHHSDDPDGSIAWAFNYAMAKWGYEGKPAHSPFKRVVQLHLGEPKQATASHDANYLQCIALSHWAIGSAETAKQMAEQAKTALHTPVRGAGGPSRPEPTFSCWRYLTVRPHDFEKDIDEMVAMFDGTKRLKPQFMSAARLEVQ